MFSCFAVVVAVEWRCVSENGGRERLCWCDSRKKRVCGEKINSEKTRVIKKQQRAKDVSQISAK